MAMLARAKTAPLYVNLDSLLSRGGPDAVRAVLAEHPKFASLSLSASSSDMQELLKLITSPMLRLTALRLTPRGSEVSLRNTIFENMETPCLRSVTLSGCLLPPSAKCLSNLSHIEISLDAWGNPLGQRA